MTAQVKAAEHREPLVRIAKRTDISRGKSWAIRAAAIVLALLLGALIMLLLGHNPIPGELLLYDGRRLELDRVPVERGTGCPVCGIC